jgi:hypothetical protein
VVIEMNVLRNSLDRARFRVGLIVAGLGALAVPASAAAQSPTDSQYSSNLQFVAEGGSGGSGSPGGDLPFTGLDVGLLALVAGGLLVAGLMLRRQRPKKTLEA